MESLVIMGAVVIGKDSDAENTCKARDRRVEHRICW